MAITGDKVGFTGESFSVSGGKHSFSGERVINIRTRTVKSYLQKRQTNFHIKNQKKFLKTVDTLFTSMLL
ncbi:hypothetical protein [Fictibacillus phosphorivorans]|uniref:hypothetical protein n=1 Tax=Fictibacillus phosphorivorans TaxID=1221500 RepID=UPI001293A7AB|nr:hypothetical protein [Fictibacillus phosphorivorans]MQR93663.1 hypothetical protein [Fictibacillus phosphorivorans]